MEGPITDPDRLLELEQGYKQDQLDALTWQPMTKAPISTGSGVIGCSWRVEKEFQPAYTYPEQFHDKEKMLHVQMQKANYMRYRCIGRIPGVWAEFKGMIPTMFGAKLELMADAASMEGLWYRHCEDDLKAIVDRGLPPLAAGLFPTIKEFTEYFRDHLPDGFYLGIPGIGEAFSWAVDILGPRIYTEVYDRPELVHQLLDLITETMIKTDAALYKIAGYERLDETWYLGGFVPGSSWPLTADDSGICGPVLCQKSAGKYFGAMSVNQRFPKTGFCGDPHPQRHRSKLQGRALMDSFLPFRFRWNSQRVRAGFAFMAECHYCG